MTTERNERNSLVAELGQVESAIAEMGKFISTPWPDQSPESLRASEFRRKIGDARAHAETLQDGIARIDRAETYRREAEAAPAIAEAARKAITTATEQAAKLEASASKLRARIEAIEEESRSAEQKAFDSEADAARAYARSIAGADDAAEKEASDRLKKAQTATANVRGKITANAAVLDALRNELAALEEQAQAARDEASEHRTRMARAILTGLEARWDSIADELAAVGAEIQSARRNAGFGGDAFWKLHIPLFGPTGADFISGNNLPEAIIEPETEAAA
ncbi:hypothetical protein AGMMS50256_30710 [Betaproteobacteria bacterium]|nr:hypothetical protein AGMMS50256_30710 [Betaproteobacteria bacterium]